MTEYAQRVRELDASEFTFTPAAEGAATE